jgi:hypothetical protein
MIVEQGLADDILRLEESANAIIHLVTSDGARCNRQSETRRQLCH